MIKRGTLLTDGYVLIPKAWLNDANLSWEARGLLAWFTTFPVGVEITEGLVSDVTGVPLKVVGEGALRELEDNGYIRPDPTSNAATVAFVLTGPSA